MSPAFLPRALVAGALALLALPARADTLHVPSKAFPTLSDAAAALQPGDVVKIAPGIYEEAVLLDVPGVTLVGKGAVLDGGQQGFILFVTADDVTLRGLTLLSGVTAVTAQADRLAVIGCTFRAQQGHALDVDGDGLRVETCTFDALAHDAIEVASATSTALTTVAGNTFTRVYGSPLVAIGGRIVVTKNRASDVLDDFVLQPTHPTEASLFAGNRIEQSDDGGLWARCASAAGIVVESNDFSRCDFDAIQIDLVDSAGTVVRKNRLRDLSADGIEVFSEGISSAVIEDNEIRSVLDDGIAVFGTGVIVRRNSVSDTNNEGIEFLGAGEVSDNVVRDASGLGILADADGIAGGVLVARNRVRNTVFDGILAFGDDHEIVGNVVSHVVGDGIDVGGGANVTVADNRVSKCLHEGLQNSGLATVVQGNRLRRNGLDLAGRGTGDGAVSTFADNVFSTGSPTTARRWEVTSDI